MDMAVSAVRGCTAFGLEMQSSAATARKWEQHLILGILCLHVCAIFFLFLLLSFVRQHVLWPRRVLLCYVPWLRQAPSLQVRRRKMT